jgi:hypothetical protein
MKACISGIIALCMLCCTISAIIPCASAEDTLTRGSGFTVTITGKPNTAYYVWLARTFTMSGEPGDQPPVILSNQMNVVQDPAEGPYVIGSYRYNNGNGRTIRDDVAPSSSTTSNTRYYAQVTTDIDGVAIVGFRTSSATADKKFSILAQNPQSPGETVYVRLGLPAQKTTPAATAPQPTDTTPSPSPSLPQDMTPPATSSVPVQSPPAGSVPATMRQTTVELPLILAAAGLGLRAMLRWR